MAAFDSTAKLVKKNYLMRILLDPQIFNEQVFGGISRYYTEIFSNLAQNRELQLQLPVYASDNAYLKNSILYTPEQKRNSFFLSVLKKIGVSVRKKIRKKNRQKAINALQKQDFDVFIPTYYDPYFLEFIGSKPFVLTVYDMIHELFPQYFTGDTTTVKNKLLLMEKATRIIAVSENTKKDILRIYPHIDASKIEVIYHGSSIKIEDIAVNLPKEYILFVGVRKFYKNFEFLLRSVRQLLSENPNLHLVCAGGGKFTEEESAFIKGLGLPDQVVQKSFEEKELGQFYKEAKCFVFPSDYEGFGIPVVEAMACGCPVVLTHNSSFPEVAGDAGIFFEKGNAEDLKNKIESLLKDEQLRSEFAAKGLARAKMFDWDKAAMQCYELYKKAINE